jgi:hypothetical protein
MTLLCSFAVPFDTVAALPIHERLPWVKELGRFSFFFLRGDLLS